MRFICQDHGEVKPTRLGYSCPKAGWCPVCHEMLTDEEEEGGGIRVITSDEANQVRSYSALTQVRSGLTVKQESKTMKIRTGKECKKTDCVRYEEYKRWSCSNSNLQTCMNCKWAYVSQFERKSNNVNLIMRTQERTGER